MYANMISGQFFIDLELPEDHLFFAWNKLWQEYDNY